MSYRVAFRLAALALAACAASTLHAGTAAPAATPPPVVATVASPTETLDQPVAFQKALADFIQTY